MKKMKIPINGVLHLTGNPNKQDKDLTENLNVTGHQRKFQTNLMPATI